MKSLSKNSVYNLIYIIANMFFPLIMSMYTSRIFLDNGIGQFEYARNVVSYFVTFATMGITVYGTRMVAQSKAGQELNRSFTELFVINFSTTVIAIIIYIIVVVSVSKFRNNLTLYIACGLQLLLNVFNVDWFYRGKEEYGYIVIRSIVVKTISFVAILLMIKKQDQIVEYAFISSFALAGNYIWNVINLKKYVKFDLSDIHLVRHFKPLLILLITSFLGHIYNSIDVTMLGVLSTDSSVGLYSNAHKSLNLVLSGTTAITAVYLPRLSFVFKEKKDEFNEILQKGFDIVIFISLPATVGLFLVADSIIPLLFGSAFAAAGTCLKLFSVLVFIRTIGDLFCYQVIIAIGEEKKRLLYNLIGTVVNVLLNYFLIREFAQNGATVASIFAELVINIPLFIFAVKKTNLHINVVSFIKILISTAIMGTVVFVLMLLPLNGLVKTVIAIFIGIFIYFILCYILKLKILMDGLVIIREKIKGRKCYDE